MDVTRRSQALIEKMLRAAWIGLLIEACAPASQGSTPSSSHRACAAASCAASSGVATAGAAAPTRSAMMLPITPTVPVAGAATPPPPPPPPPPAQTNTAAPPKTPAAGTSPAIAGRASAPAAGSGGGGAGSAGTNLSGVSDDELNTLRQACVDQINMYRAMLPNLKPLKRASPAQEACADQGAQMDGDAMVPHQSARMGLCARQGLSSENMCGGFQGGTASTVMNGLTLCEKGFWAEGEPSNGRQACMMDLSGCYEQHGHYLNMSDPNIGVVACAFYKLKNGTMWMNNDFGY